jgi:uncharacterized protein DUF6788
MTIEHRRQEILQQMNAITRMERGKLSVQHPAQAATPFYKLQCWHNGKNQTRYIPAAEVPDLQQALAGHERFQLLAKEFVELTVASTRREQEADRKKNSRKSKTSATGRPKPS